MAEERSSTVQLEVSASNWHPTQEVATAATGTSESNAVKDCEQTTSNTPSGSVNDDPGCSAFPVFDSESAEPDADELESRKYVAEMTDEQMNELLLEMLESTRTPALQEFTPDSEIVADVLHSDL